MVDAPVVYKIYLMPFPPKNILLVTERYCDSNPLCGSTNSEHMLAGTLRASGLVESVNQFYFDEIGKNIGVAAMSELLISECQ